MKRTRIEGREIVRVRELIAPAFLPVHRDVRAGGHAEYWLMGGRGSAKSSFVSLEIVLGLLRAASNANGGMGGVECEIRMHDKNRALELLGKHLGLFADNLRAEPELPVIVDDVEDRHLPEGDE